MAINKHVRTPMRPAFTVVELLVVVAVVIILLGLLLPSLSHLRETSRRAACLAKLHDIGMALLQYETVFQVLPAGRDGLKQRDHSWLTALLPFLGQSELYARYSYQHAWNDQSPGVQNKGVADTMLSAFLCPSTEHSLRGATDYGGNYGSSLSGLRKGFGLGRAWDSGVLLAVNTPARREPRKELIRLDAITDGLGCTFAVLEDAGRSASQGGQWANGQQCLAHEYASINENRLQGLYSDHPGGAHALLVDGTVKFLTTSTSSYVLGAYSTRANKDSIEGKSVAAR